MSSRKRPLSTGLIFFAAFGAGALPAMAQDIGFGARPPPIGNPPIVNPGAGPSVPGWWQPGRGAGPGNPEGPTNSGGGGDGGGVGGGGGGGSR